MSSTDGAPETRGHRHQCPNSPLPLTVDAETLRQQLVVTADTFREFLEWRHKIMTRTAVVAGAGAVAMQWLNEHQGPNEFGADDRVRALPLLVVSMVCVVAALLDAVNQRVMNSCYQTGSDMEDWLGVGASGFFHQLDRLFAPGEVRLS